MISDELNNEEYNEEEITEEDIDNTEQNENYIFYTNRLKKLIKLVAEKDGFDIGFSDEGTERLHSTIKYLVIILTYEIINTLKEQNRKRIKPKYVDEALTKMIGNTDSFGIVIGKLNELINNLESFNNSTSVTKAIDFLNLLNLEAEEKN